MNLEKKYFEIKEYVTKLLQDGLSKNLFFHSINHTMQDVLIYCEILAKNEKVDDDEMYLLLIAALFHDTGYIFQYDKNEFIGQQIAEKNMKLFGFDSKEIERVKQIIAVTEVDFSLGYPVQNPDKNDILQKIICDADLLNIGREDFFDQTENLIKEMQARGKSFNRNKWWDTQYKFLINHNYFTSSARRLLNIGKQRNLCKLVQIIDSSYR